jgi:methylated-DNA-protein-cysteine methyltransferase-like protein
MTSFFDAVYRVLALVPPGRVVSYGQIAAMLGYPRAARTVGWALHGLPVGSGLPWHRVINVHGRITTPCQEHTAARQRELLEGEGVVFGPDDRVDMSMYRWAGPTFEQLDAIRRPRTGGHGGGSDSRERGEEWTALP